MTLWCTFRFWDDSEALPGTESEELLGKEAVFEIWKLGGETSPFVAAPIGLRRAQACCREASEGRVRQVVTERREGDGLVARLGAAMRKEPEHGWAPDLSTGSGELADPDAVQQDVPRDLVSQVDLWAQLRIVHDRRRT